MVATSKSFLAMTAADLMSRDVVMVPREISLRGAAHLLSEARVSGAPVVDETGRCVGVLSAIDLMHWVGYGERAAHGTEAQYPEDVYSAWQAVNVETMPQDTVSNYMTTDPVTVLAGTPVAALARAMVDVHIHRIIVVDAMDRPIGIVSSTDILAALTNAENRRIGGH